MYGATSNQRRTPWRLVALVAVLLIGGCGRQSTVSPLDQAEQYALQGQWPEAIAAYDEYIKANTMDAHAFLLRGQAQLAAGDVDRAIADFSRSIDLKPQEPEAYYQRAMAYRKRGREGDELYANDDAQRARDLDPEYAAAYSNIVTSKSTDGNSTPPTVTPKDEAKDPDGTDGQVAGDSSGIAGDGALPGGVGDDTRPGDGTGRDTTSAEPPHHGPGTTPGSTGTITLDQGYARGVPTPGVDPLHQWLYHGGTIGSQGGIPDYIPGGGLSGGTTTTNALPSFPKLPGVDDPLDLTPTPRDDGITHSPEDSGRGESPDKPAADRAPPARPAYPGPYSGYPGMPRPYTPSTPGGYPFGMGSPRPTGITSGLPSSGGATPTGTGSYYPYPYGGGAGTSTTGISPLPSALGSPGNRPDWMTPLGARATGLPYGVNLPYGTTGTAGTAYPNTGTGPYGTTGPITGGPYGSGGPYSPIPGFNGTYDLYPTFGPPGINSFAPPRPISTGIDSRNNP